MVGEKGGEGRRGGVGKGGGGARDRPPPAPSLRPAPSSSSDSDAPAPPRKRATTPSRRAGPRAARGPSLASAARAKEALNALLDAGLVAPGPGALVVDGVEADLSSDGGIALAGALLPSPAALVAAARGAGAPSRAADGGFKAVFHAGVSLDELRRRLERGDTAPAAAEPAAATDHWVQCDRCQTWRIVPDAHWAAVEADEREAWFCEWAAWRVETAPPHTPACAVPMAVL